jgi:drug/metabolite transporter (DMT)-like permease
LLIPVFTALFAILIYGESLQARLLLGGAVVLAGVWIQQVSSTDDGKQGGFPAG